MKKCISVFLSIIIILSVAPCVFAAEEDNSVIIWSARDLEKVRENLDGDYILACDIEMSDVTDFSPIGSTGTPFTGTFDGNGHSIKNLKISVQYDRQNGDEPLDISLFGAVSGGTVKNLDLTSVYYLCRSSGYTTAEAETFALSGGVTGQLLNGGLIENCSVSGTVASIGYYNCFARSGGIVGYSVSSTIRNCSFNGLVFAAADYTNSIAGGISAWAENTEISNCFVEGKMHSANTNAYVYAGGVVGSGSSSISNSVVALSEITVEGIKTVSGTLLTDAICTFGTQTDCVASSTTTQALQNKGALALPDNLIKVEIVYTDRNWDFDNIWEMSDSAPRLVHKNTEQFITETDSGMTIRYDNTVLTSNNGILMIEGTDGIYGPDSEKTTPIDFFADESQVIIVGEQIPYIDQNTFNGFENVEIVALKGNTTIGSGAFYDSDKIELIYCYGSVVLEENAFNDAITADVFVPVNNDISEAIPQNTKLHTISTEADKLHISGELEIDAYFFFDLCALLCNSYNDVSHILIDKFICNNIQFYRINDESGFPEPVWDHTLTNVDISVKISDENDNWNEITWNYLCELGITDNLDNFKLTVTADEYAEIEDTEIEIKDDNEVNFFQRLLKFITSLLDRLFKLFSKL